MAPELLWLAAEICIDALTAINISITPNLPEADIPRYEHFKRLIAWE